MSAGSSYGSVLKPTQGSKAPLIAREEDRFRTDTPYQDKSYAILFLLYTLLISILSIFFYAQNTNTYTSNTTNSNNEYLNQHFAQLLFASIGISVVNACILLFILRKYSLYLTWLALSLSFILFLIYGIVLITAFHSIIAGICILIIAIIQFLWMYCIRHRIEFTAALISISIDALNHFLSSYIVSLFGIFLQIIWCVVWCLGFAYSIDGASATKMTIILYFFAFYWTIQVISNVMLCTTSGTVSMWYFLYPSHCSNHTVYKSLKRSITTSFGSVCFGSLIIGIVQCMRMIINAFRSILRERKNSNVCIECITHCIACSLQCVEGIIDYVNNYAFVRVSIYGMSYCHAARQTFELFASRGFEVVINDDLTHSVLMLSCLLCSALTGLIIGAISKYSFGNESVESVTLWSFTAFFISFAISMSCLVVVKAAVSALFVCFAEGIDCFVL